MKHTVPDSYSCTYSEADIALVSPLLEYRDSTQTFVLNHVQYDCVYILHKIHCRRTKFDLGNTRGHHHKMQDPNPPGTSYLSPKRKRDDQDSLMTDSPSPSRLRTTNLPIRPVLEEEVSSGCSPRTSVAGHLQGLDLHPHNKIPQLEFDQDNQFQMGAHKSSFGSSTFTPHIFLPNPSYNTPVTPPPSSDGPLSMISKLDTKSYAINGPVEIPETPRLRPVSSPTPPPSATVEKPQKLSPSSPAQTLWWSDSEITGHDPKDPSDDGYGINGVGFLPTPAIANARVERRKRQVAEWKNREAREARQKRSDRRRRRDLEAGAAGNPIVHNEAGSSADEGRRVRFLEV